MENSYSEKMRELGYDHLVCNIFTNWEDVKDEILIPERKAGSGNGTIHVFLGAADDELRKEFPSYYSIVKSESDASDNAIPIKHFFLYSNVISMIGHVCQYCYNNGDSIDQPVSEILSDLSNYTVDNGFLSTNSLFKLSTGSNKLRPYFKQFDSDGVFTKLVRRLLLPNSAYKISLYKNAADQYAALWLIGFDNFSDFEADSSSNHFIVKPCSDTSSLQQIYYGAPGTGKSFEINRLTKGKEVIRTTFHPDSDYSTFVGAYKPTSIEVPVRDVTGKIIVENGKQVTENRIVYEFVEQAFLQAYTKAWEAYANCEAGAIPKVQYLVIEEINRGNCAQIFGDLFQLLDRNNDGFSDYPITADNDMHKQLANAFKNLTIADAGRINAIYGKDVVSKVLNGEILLLPDNLYIWATMNTSDQSLFPIDSAFKRRWEWKYIPICEGRNENGQRLGYMIEANGRYYDWWTFLDKINKEIDDQTKSEDKKLGYFFCKADADGIIKAETFVSKVLFYLWNDVFKDQTIISNMFRDGDVDMTFAMFYGADNMGKTMILENKVEKLLANLGLVPFEDEHMDFEDDSDTPSGQSENGQRDKTKYSVNGEGTYLKKKLPFEAVSIYVKNHPNDKAQEIVNAWSALETMIRQIVITSNDFEQKLSQSSDDRFETRYYSLNLNSGEKIYVYNQFTPERINDFISKVNAQNWGIHIETAET